MSQKQKPIIFIEDMPIIVTVAVLVVGLGTVLGLIAYSIFGINKYTKPTVKTSSINVVENNYFGNEFIQVKLPQGNATIKSPVLISGKANVFEANVRVKIKGENENVLADTFITASGAYDKLYQFEKEISYNSPTSQNGAIEIFEESSKDGSEINKIIIPVIFGDYADIRDETADWETYRNEEYGFKVKYPKDFSFEISYGHVGPGVPGGEYENTAVAIHFIVPTIKPIYPNGPKERPILTILVYTKKQWEEFGFKYYQELSQTEKESVLLGENRELTFISDNVARDQQAPSDFISKAQTIDQIISTFKFIEK